MASPKYKRILLKLSGEALMGDADKASGSPIRSNINPDIINRIAQEVVIAHNMGVQVAIVVGAGNIFRGSDGKAWGMDKAAADYVGMLATIMNCLILQEVLKQTGVETRVMTAIAMPAVAEPFIRLRAVRHLDKGRVVIFGGGTGNPLVTTDTAGALRAAEINANVLLMAKNKVDGIYSDDPRKNKNAQKYSTMTPDEYFREGLKVMDPSAVAICQENNIPIVVFDFEKEGSIKKIILGESVGTLVATPVGGG